MSERVWPDMLIGDIVTTLTTFVCLSAIEIPFFDQINQKNWPINVFSPSLALTEVALTPSAWPGLGLHIIVF